MVFPDRARLPYLVVFLFDSRFSLVGLISEPLQLLGHRRLSHPATDRQKGWRVGVVEPQRITA
jgi:hypothetical protein